MLSNNNPLRPNKHRKGHDFLVHGLVVIAWPVDGNGKRRSPWPARKY